MTTWIGTNQAGWDNQSIGFHSMSACTGLVVSTPGWVAGWHIGGGAGGDYAGTGHTKAGAQAEAFRRYLRTIGEDAWPAVGRADDAVELLVVHKAMDDWQTVLDEFAKGIGYHGLARGFDLGGRTGRDPCDYVISHLGGRCTVQYKRTSKMVHVTQTDDQRRASVVRTLRSGEGFGSPFEAVELTNNESHSASIRRTFSNGGNMHFAAARSFSSIVV